MDRDTILEVYEGLTASGWPGLGKNRYVLVETREGEEFWITDHESIAEAALYRDRQEETYRREWQVDALWDTQTGEEYLEETEPDTGASRFESWGE